MARFTVESVDYDQFGGGIHSAVEEMQRLVPITARLHRQIPGPDGRDYALAVLQKQINFLPPEGFDWSRGQPECFGKDEAGEFVTIYAIAIAPLWEGAQLHEGMRAFPVRMAYIVDNTVGSDDQLDFNKCEYIGYAMINDLPEPSAST